MRLYCGFVHFICLIAYVSTSLSSFFITCSVSGIFPSHEPAFIPLRLPALSVTSIRWASYIETSNRKIYCWIQKWVYLVFLRICRIFKPFIIVWLRPESVSSDSLIDLFINYLFVLQLTDLWIDGLIDWLIYLFIYLISSLITLLFVILWF